MLLSRSNVILYEEKLNLTIFQSFYILNTEIILVANERMQFPLLGLIEILLLLIPNVIKLLLHEKKFSKKQRKSNYSTI